jgi:hypothetical protein
MAQKKAAASIITLIIFVLATLIISAVIGAIFFYNVGAKAQTAGNEPFSTLAKAREKLAGNFPDLEIDPSMFEVTCTNGVAVYIKTAVVNLGKKTAESPETGRFYVCEIDEDGQLQLFDSQNRLLGAEISQLGSAGKKVVVITRFLSYATGAGVFTQPCPPTVTATINADCEDWIDEGNEDNNEIVRICQRYMPADYPNVPCNEKCTYECRAP